ncbi:MAG: D-glycerate dehydrogenase [Candidatus Bathyarchaeota archaeon]|nr:D-glycerate dehydrogenase [Candidatus Bathyarchaeota archaeon]
MKYKVLISSGKNNVPEDVSKDLEAYAEVEYVKRPYTDKLADATAVIVGTEPINDQYLDKAPNLKIVARFGVGYDSVDVDTCTKRGIIVTHTPDVLSVGVAEHTWALILGFTRRIPLADRHTKEHWTNRDRSFPFGWDIEGKTLGILGLGRIGAEILKRAQGFDLNLIYSDLMRRKYLEEKYGVRYVEFEELLRESDILSVNVTLTPMTRGIIGEKELAMMKQEAVIVNTSRGSVIDEKALIRALKDGKIRGAALDVFETEPTPLDNPLLKLENVVMSPHIASATWETRRKMAVRAVSNVKAFLEGKRPPHVVPEQRDITF